MDFLSDLKSQLLYHKDIGLSPVSLTADISRFLAVEGRITDLTRSGHTKDLGERKPEKTAKVNLTSVEDIENEIVNCTLCTLGERHSRPVSGRGSSPIRLLIVGDWLDSANWSTGLDAVFGLEQDEMLGKMLEAMTVPRQDVFVTNLIKCIVPAGQQPLAGQVESCLGHLEKQILALRPEFICAMGSLAAKTLVKRRAPLSRLRGAFYEYSLETGESCKVMVTYHPTYLQQNPDMKRAAWLDLQLLARTMGLTPRL